MLFRSLDSFILFNEETLDEQVTLIELMAGREEGVNNTEMSKPSLELQVMYPLLLNLDTKENDPQINANPGESKLIQLSIDTQEQSEGTSVK